MTAESINLIVSKNVIFAMMEPFTDKKNCSATLKNTEWEKVRKYVFVGKTQRDVFRFIVLMLPICCVI